MTENLALESARQRLKDFYIEKARFMAVALEEFGSLSVDAKKEYDNAFMRAARHASPHAPNEDPFGAEARLHVYGDALLSALNENPEASRLAKKDFMEHGGLPVELEILRVDYFLQPIITHLHARAYGTNERLLDLEGGDGSASQDFEALSTALGHFQTEADECRIEIGQQLKSLDMIVPEGTTEPCHRRLEGLLAGLSGSAEPRNRFPYPKERASEAQKKPSGIGKKTLVKTPKPNNVVSQAAPVGELAPDGSEVQLG